LNRGLATQLIAIVAVVGFLCFAGGYLVAGGITKQSGQYAYGENITVNVKIADLSIDKQSHHLQRDDSFRCPHKVRGLRHDIL